MQRQDPGVHAPPLWFPFHPCSIQKHNSMDISKPESGSEEPQLENKSCPRKKDRIRPTWTLLMEGRLLNPGLKLLTLCSLKWKKRSPVVSHRTQLPWDCKMMGRILGKALGKLQPAKTRSSGSANGADICLLISQGTTECAQFREGWKQIISNSMRDFLSKSRKLMCYEDM